jgi:hypothetical protein
MRFGLIYATPGLYDLAMRTIYRDRHDERFRTVADEVEEGDEVVDLCAGTAFLYDALAGKSVHYRAFDINPRFVRALRLQGVSAECLDVEKMHIPAADIVTMSSALYHFYPRCTELLQKMRLSARKKVVLVEPINNNANSNLPLWGAFARWVSRVDGREVPFHFDRESLERLCDELSGPQRRELVCGDRDMRVVLEAGDYCLSAAMQKDGICAKTS